MSKASTLKTPQQAADEAGVKLGKWRRWAWKLDIVPVKREQMQYETKRGGRVGLQSFYSPAQVKQVKDAMGKKS